MVGENFSLANNLSIQVEKTEKTPVYIQLAAQLKQEIANRYKADDFLPSENQLAKTFSVNRHTVRRALDELVTQGLIMRHQGKGSQVLCKHKLKYELNIGKFTTTVNRQNKSSMTMIDSVEKVKATAELTTVFGGDANTLSIVLIKTVRIVDGEPMCVIHHYLNEAHVPNIANKFKSGSLHKCILDNYGFGLKRKEAEISARLPIADEAELLDTHQSQPVLVVKSINCVQGDDNKIVEYSNAIERADRIKINISY